VIDASLHRDSHDKRQRRLIEFVLVHGDIIMLAGVLRPRDGGPREHRLVGVDHAAAGLKSKLQLLHHLHLPYYGILHLLWLNKLLEAYGLFLYSMLLIDLFEQAGVDFLLWVLPMEQLAPGLE